MDRKQKVGGRGRQGEKKKRGKKGGWKEGRKERKERREEERRVERGKTRRREEGKKECASLTIQFSYPGDHLLKA